MILKLQYVTIQRFKIEHLLSVIGSKVSFTQPLEESKLLTFQNFLAETVPSLHNVCNKLYDKLTFYP